MSAADARRSRSTFTVGRAPLAAGAATAAPTSATPTRAMGNLRTRASPFSNSRGLADRLGVGVADPSCRNRNRDAVARWRRRHPPPRRGVVRRGHALDPAVAVVDLYDGA